MVYGAKDMSDDEIIGLKSTSIKFKNNIRMFVLVSYFISTGLIIYLFKDLFGTNFFTFFLIMYVLSLIYQLFKLKKNNITHIINMNNISNLMTISDKTNIR